MSAARTADPPDARELAIVAGLTLLAFGLRAWHWSSIGLTQYDEGVYALSGMGVADGAGGLPLFRDQQKFSPPVYISLVALAYRLGGISDLSAVMVNVIMGTLTVPLIWKVARSWFGPATAVAASVLMSMSELHITLSRSALTDVTFTFLFLVAIAALVWAVERGGVGRAIAAGVAVGLAWNTKYHGWFALAIVAGAIVAQWRYDALDDRRQRVTRALQSWAIAGAVALACYLPWMAFIQGQTQATSGWLMHYARFLRLNWFGNLLEYAREQNALEGAVSRASIPFAAVCATFVARRQDGTRGAPTYAGLALVSFGAVLLGSFGTSVALSLVALARLLRRDRRLVVWTLLGWLALWFVAAPLYEPYFRLLVPLTGVLFILGGNELARLSAAAVANLVQRRMAGLVAAGIVFATGFVWSDSTSPWREARSVAWAARAIDERVPPGAPVWVMGEPPLQFYLHRAGHPSFEEATVGAIDSARTPVFLVTGRYVKRARVLGNAIRRHEAEVEMLERYPIAPSDLRLFDDTRRRRGREYRRKPDDEFDLTLYRYTPAREQAVTGQLTSRRLWVLGAGVTLLSLPSLVWHSTVGQAIGVITVEAREAPRR